MKPQIDLSSTFLFHLLVLMGFRERCPGKVSDLFILGKVSDLFILSGKVSDLFILFIHLSYRERCLTYLSDLFILLSRFLQENRQVLLRPVRLDNCSANIIRVGAEPYGPGRLVIMHMTDGAAARANFCWGMK